MGDNKLKTLNAAKRSALDVVGFINIITACFSCATILDISDAMVRIKTCMQNIQLRYISNTNI